MTRLQPFSDHRGGLFVSVDGPSAAGKSTIVAHLAQQLVADGDQVHVTAEPSTSRIGKLARELTDTITGPALACLYAADRYHHLETEIRPRTAAGEVVLCDRYVPSGLVMQRFDDIDPAFLWGLNSLVDRPDLTVILDTDPEIIGARLAERRAHNRFQLTPLSSHAEAHFYRQACDRLIQAGYDILRVETGNRRPNGIAAEIRDRLRALFAVPSEAIPDDAW